LITSLVSVDDLSTILTRSSAAAGPLPPRGVRRQRIGDPVIIEQYVVHDLGQLWITDRDGELGVWRRHRSDLV